MRASRVLGAMLFLGASLASAQTYQATVLYPLNDIAQNSVVPRRVTAYGSVGLDSFNSATVNALLWSPPGGAATDLDPTNLGAVFSAKALGISASQQVGSFTNSSGEADAVLWSGSGSSAIDLNPTQLGAFNSQAIATDGTQQVGRGTFGTSTDRTGHALLWSGTPDSAVDLNPTNPGSSVGSVALGIGGGQEVGDYSSSSSPTHAVLWTGSADSAVDLHPLDPSLAFSEAVATSGTQQVGSARAIGGGDQAFLWFGTAASAINLNPISLSGIDSSIAVATNGIQQVGTGYDDSVPADNDQALVWSGRADSVVDLQPFLPASGSWSFSDATSIDANGNVYGYSYGTFNNTSGYFAVEWSGVPEPASLMLMCVGFPILLGGRRMKSGGRLRTMASAS